MRNLKVIFLALLFGGIGAVALIDGVAIGWYPPVAHLPRWSEQPFAAGRCAQLHGRARVVVARRCVGARGAGTTARPSWSETQALGAFGWRYWGLVISCAITLLAPFGFAFAIRLGRAPSRVLRGRRLLTGDDARRSFLRSAAREIPSVRRRASSCCPAWPSAASARRGTG